MANVLFTRTDTPSEKPITDGQLIFDTSGNGKMYLDNGTNRLEMGGALTVDATLSKTSTNPVQNKAVAGVMLDTLSDIGNVTSKGFLTDALAVKQLNTNVNELNNSLDNLLISELVESESFTTTNANFVQWPASIDISKDGYVAIGIVGVTCTNYLHLLSSWQLNDNKISFTVIMSGKTTADQTGKAQFRVLYMKQCTN